MVTEKIELHDRVSITDSVTYRARTEMADIYLKEAERQVEKARQSFDISLKSKDNNERSKALRDEKQSSLFTIMFSVFALESYINMVGHDKLSKEEWELLKLDKLERKWYIFPTVLTKKPFDITSQLFRNFRRIIDLRNYLVHYKDYDYKEFVEHPCSTQVSGIYEHVNVENAELAYNTANDMIKKLAGILKK